jgi:hypothetical protein
LAERFAFSVAYTASIFASAARLHLWRSLTTGWRRFASLAMVASVLAINFIVFGPLRAVPLSALEIGLPLAGVVWRSQRAMRASWVGRLKNPQARFVVSDDSVEVSTDANSGRLRFDAVKQIWKFKRLWLLMLDPTRFVTLPLAGAPAEALQILNANIRPRPL